MLEDFDKIWVKYEKCYVYELMIIEQDARRFVAEAIDFEKLLVGLETRDKDKI